MKRLGLFTGKVYTQEDFDNHNIHECCLCITDSEAEDTEYIVNKHLSHMEECRRCYGCPESRSALI